MPVIKTEKGFVVVDEEGVALTPPKPSRDQAIRERKRGIVTARFGPETGRV
jgi:hypothetical protein